MTLRKNALFMSFAVKAILLLTACNPGYVSNPQLSASSQQQNQQGQSGQQSGQSDTGRNGVVYGAPIQNQQGQQTNQGSGQQAINIVQPLERRVILKDAQLQIVVENVASTLDAISKMAEDMGGWVINSNTTKISNVSGNSTITGSIAIRVPAAQLEAALTQIKSQSSSVDLETITGTDVTQDYTDLNSQLTNLQAAEKQLQTILDSATTTDDVLKIYNELVRVRGEIETTQGRINFFKQASDFSSISVSLRPPTVPKEAVQVDTGWSPATTIKGAFNALVNILQLIANLIIIIAVLVLPLVVIIGIPVWLIRKLMRRYGWIKSQTRAAKDANPPSNTKVENDVG